MMKRLGVFFLAVGFAMAAFAADTEQPADSGPDRFESTNPAEVEKRKREIAERVRKILAGIEGREGSAGGRPGAGGTVTDTSSNATTGDK